MAGDCTLLCDFKRDPFPNRGVMRERFFFSFPKYFLFLCGGFEVLLHPQFFLLSLALRELNEYFFSFFFPIQISFMVMRKKKQPP